MLSIVVVDDEPDNFDVIEALLSAQDYHLSYASDGYEVLDRLNLEKVKPDLILLDVMMPGINGIEVCKRIRALPSGKMIPIIMVTALNDKKDLESCLQAGADDFLSKPVNSVELIARIKSLLRIKQQYDKIESFSQSQRNTIIILRENLQELRDNLASTLPHELNTPLNGILNPIELVLDELNDQQQEINRERLIEVLEIAYNSALDLEKLTRKYRHYVHLELITQPPTAKEIGTSAKSTIEEVAIKQAEKAGRLSDLTMDLPDVSLNIPPDYLKWLINELVENAFKFSQAQTPVIVQGELKNGLFHLAITDKGPGMTPAQIAKIDSFVQFERKTQGQQGLGLGLKIVQETVRIFKGKFSVSSNSFSQTTFNISLPIAT